MLRSASLSFILSAFGIASAAHGQNIGMPAGARTWIAVSGSTVDNGNCCDEAAGETQALPYPSPNYVRYGPYISQGLAYYANGEVLPNRVRSAYARVGPASPMFVYNSMVDTYTITGPPGSEGTPVNARVTFRVVGPLCVGYWCCGVYVGGSYLTVEVGTWDGNTDPFFHEGSRVIAFGAGFTQSASIPGGNHGAIQPIMQVDTAVDQVLSRTVGQPFDLAFGMNLSGDGAANPSGSPAPSDYIVGTIDWELPAGYTITSLLGWTDPNAPACDPLDFNGDGLTPDTADIDDFLSVFSGGPCSTGTCGDLDFNNDGLFPDTADIDSLLSVFSGGACT